MSSVRNWGDSIKDSVDKRNFKAGFVVALSLHKDIKSYESSGAAGKFFSGYSEESIKKAKENISKYNRAHLEAALLLKDEELDKFIDVAYEAQQIKASHVAAKPVVVKEQAKKPEVKATLPAKETVSWGDSVYEFFHPGYLKQKKQDASQKAKDEIIARQEKRKLDRQLREAERAATSMLNKR